MTIKIVKLNAAQSPQQSENNRQVSGTRAETVDTGAIVGEMHRLGQSAQQIDPVEQNKLREQQKYLSETYDIKDGISAEKDNICRRIEMPDGRRFIIYENEVVTVNDDGEVVTYKDYKRVEIAPGGLRTMVKRERTRYKTAEEAANAGEIKCPMESVLIDNATGQVTTYYDSKGNKTNFAFLGFEPLPGVCWPESE